jgi:hypothetical protein
MSAVMVTVKVSKSILHNNNKFKDVKDLSKSAVELFLVVSVLKVRYADILKGFVID